MAHETLLSRADAALVVVDMQERRLPAMHEGAAAVEAARRLATGLRWMDVPVFATEQTPQGLGPTAAPVAEALGDGRRWPKTSFSAAECEPFMDALDDAGRDQVVVCGFETHIGVLQTALDLANRGVQVHLAADACASRHRAHHDNALARLAREGVVVTNVESALFECLGAAGTDLFTRVCALIR